MREKIVGGFYSVLSAAVWFSAFCGILFLFYLLFTADTRPPVITVHNTTAPTIAAEDDAFLLEKQQDPSEWYTVTMDLTVKASALSPFSFSAESFYLRNTNGMGSFVVASEPIAYSHVDPQDLTVTLYIHNTGDADTLSSRLENAELRLQNKTMHVGFFDIKLY